MWIELTAHKTKVSINFNLVESYYERDEKTRITILNNARSIYVNESYEEIKAKVLVKQRSDVS